MADPHFNISASVVRQLGDELVSDEVTAIVELVKNAYDADADYAHVVVDTNDSPGDGSKFPEAAGYITIEDDGMGMDRADIDRGWLMISLSGKRTLKASGGVTPKGRTPLGDKGLGRLSTQKLGQNLELYTRKDGESETEHVAFAWSAFTDDKSLSEVPVSIEPASSSRPKGTKLVISGLRNPDVWRGSAANKLIADLSQIISPFAEARPFLVTLRIDGRPIDLELVSAKVRDAAVAKFIVDFEDGELSLTGKFRLAKLRGNQDHDSFEHLLARDNGLAFFEDLKTRKGAPVEFSYSKDPNYFLEFSYRLRLASLAKVEMVSGLVADSDPIIADPGPFHGEIDEFLFRGDELGAKLGGLANATEVREIVKLHAGIKVFRDGFAIKPYGLNGEDWLRLSAQQTSASSYYGLRPQNVMGFVSISEAANRNLKDKTDREGFVANAYSNNFQRLMVHVTKVIFDFYDWTRRNFNRYKADLPERSKPFEGSRKAIADAEVVASRLATYSRSAKAMEANTAAASRKIAAVTTKIKQTPLMSSAAERELADLLDEAKQALEGAQELFDQLAGYSEDAKGLANIVATLSPRLDVLNDQLQDFSELAGLGLLAEALSHEVQNQTDRLMQKAGAAIKRARKTSPPNADLLVLGQDVTASASALRRQIGHLSPSLRYQRDKIEGFTVSELIDQILEHFADRWADRDIVSEVEPSSVDFRVKTNRGRLTQVIDNILLNGEYWLVDALSREKKFQPKLFIAYAAPRLRIWDNAGGIDPAVEDILFEPFVTLKPKDEGRGLGLFISAQILESMGCSIALLTDRNAQDRRYIFELNLSGIIDG